MNNPETIVAACGRARIEYLERNAHRRKPLRKPSTVLRHRAVKARASSGRARVFAVTNAKGGAGRPQSR